MYLIFTSAGDNCKTLEGIWNSHPQKTKFDVYTVFYGDNEEKSEKLKRNSKYFKKDKGGKFENLVKVYQQDKATLQKYDYIFVLDDDIIINTLELNLLFIIASKIDFSLVAPAYAAHKNGKVSHNITKQVKDCFYRQTNFVEMGTALFKRDDLFGFLDYLITLNEPILKGWGMDYMYLYFLKDKKVGVIDCIGCVNPKAEEREIDKLQSTKDRRKAWYTLRDKYKIPENKDHKNLKVVREIPVDIKKELDNIKKK